jgi:hypothetical protein
MPENPLVQSFLVDRVASVEWEDQQGCLSVEWMEDSCLQASVE